MIGAAVAPALAGASEPDGSTDGAAAMRLGLRADYFTSAAVHPVVSRIEPLAAFRLSAAETPDARLPKDDWRATWRGRLLILQPGRYEFRLEGSGHAALSIDGVEIVAGPLAPQAQSHQSQPFELGFGPHAIAVTFHPSAGPRELALLWRCGEFPWEHLPPHALSHDEADQTDDHFARGRFLVEEHNCTACHRPSDSIPISGQLASRPGPRLAAAGARLRRDWIFHWLEDPSRLRPEATMPRLFTTGRRGEVERFVLAEYLTAKGEVAAEPPHTPDELQALIAEGQRLYERIGCSACHESSADRSAAVTLRGLAQKTGSEPLAAFLQAPATVVRSGRMPSLGLRFEEAHQLAAYLLHRESPEGERAPATLAPGDSPSTAELAEVALPDLPSAREQQAFAELNRQQQLAAAAEQTLRKKRCAACHELEPGARPADPPAPAPELAAILAAKTRGCLADADGPPDGEVPRFAEGLDRARIREFLAGSRSAAGSAAPGDNARRILERFRCTACHRRNGLGGLPVEVVARLTADQSQHDAESPLPPSLTQVTHKLHDQYLRGVLLDGVRARPWLALRMPQFPHEALESLPAELASLEGAPPLAELPAAQPPGEQLEAGRRLVGVRGFGCTKCHDMLGVASTGARGPDLAGVPSRVRYDWFLHWLSDPQRLEPGTRMPTVFLDNQSPINDVLAGDPAAQREAIWQYLAHSGRLPPPEGIERAAENRFSEGNEILVARTFLPHLSPRALAIRFPSDVHLAFDAQTCRTAYLWTGQFLDMTPVWTDRGGREAGLSGPRRWIAPSAFPWEFTPLNVNDPPDVESRAADPQWGAPLPRDGQIHAPRLRFRGYRLEGDRVRISYLADFAADGQVSFDETLATLRREDGFGLARQISAELPLERKAWLLVAQCDEPPRRDIDGHALPWNGGAQPASGTTIECVHQQRTFLLRASADPGEAQWLSVRGEKKWLVYLSLRPAASPDATHLAIALAGRDGDGPSDAPAPRAVLESREMNRLLEP